MKTILTYIPPAACLLEVPSQSLVKIIININMVTIIIVTIIIVIVIIILIAIIPTCSLSMSLVRGSISASCPSFNISSRA